MKLTTWRSPENGGETHLHVVFTDRELVEAPLDALERWALASPKEYPVADTLMDASRIAFRLEQAQAMMGVEE